MEGYFNRMFSSKWLKVNGFNISIKVYKIQSHLLILNFCFSSETDCFNCFTFIA
jgi:hypothetical protein